MNSRAKFALDERNILLRQTVIEDPADPLDCPAPYVHNAHKANCLNEVLLWDCAGKEGLADLDPKRKEVPIFGRPEESAILVDFAFDPMDRSNLLVRQKHEFVADV